MTSVVMKKGLNSNALKFIAIIAMTIDHVVSVVFPNHPADGWILGNIGVRIGG